MWYRPTTSVSPVSRACRSAASGSWLTKMKPSHTSSRSDAEMVVCRVEWPAGGVDGAVHVRRADQLPVEPVDPCVIRTRDAGRVATAVQERRAAVHADVVECRQPRVVAAQHDDRVGGRQVATDPTEGSRRSGSRRDSGRSAVRPTHDHSPAKMRRCSSASTSGEVYAAGAACGPRRTAAAHVRPAQSRSTSSTVPSFHGNVDAVIDPRRRRCVGDAELAVEQRFDHRPIIARTRRTGRATVPVAGRRCGDRGRARQPRRLGRPGRRRLPSREQVAAAGHESPLLDVRPAGCSFDHHRGVVVPRHQSGLGECRHRLEVDAVAAGVPRGGGGSQTIGAERQPARTRCSHCSHRLPRSHEVRRRCSR